MFCILFSTILITASISGQEQEITDPQQHEVSVTLKLIQVYVSDKDGNPVHDLTKKDFILYDNGQIMTLTEFETYRINPEVKSRKILKDSPRINRKFFLLLDAYRNDAAGLKKARTTVLHFIDTQVQPTDELGLLSYSIGRGLVIHKPLTTTHEKTREAINAVKLFPSITTWDRGATAMQEAVDFTQSLNDFSVSLRYIPGYKYIILFSAGLPRSLFRSENPRLRFEYERLAKELASSSTHIYTVDTQGARDLIEGREQKGDDSLRRLSDLTGGHHFPNVDYREAISQDIQNATSNYYVLGYYVGEAWDGKYHEIKVQVKRKGVKVQAQKGYFNLKTFSKLSKPEKRHHLLGLARNPSPHFSLPKAIPSLSRSWWDSNSSAILHLTEIVSSDLEEILAEKIEFFTLVYNEEGVLIAEGKKDMNYTKDPPERICIYASFLQPPGKYDCISILRNKKTGAAAKAEHSVIIPECKNSQTILSGPVLFVTGGSSLCLPMDITPIEGKSITNDFNLNTITPQVEGPVSSLVYALSKDTSRLYAVFGLRKKNKLTQALEFTSCLLSKTTNKTIPIKHLHLNDILTEQDNTLVLQLELTPVPPGEYVLEISASGTALGENMIFTQNVFILWI
ncbi:MAG: VWA domain-containing protein [Candidatus Aminicenantes bacterium]|nr:VWA domain-containing protein [Candidatus Aminicenantes bacterium]